MHTATAATHRATSPEFVARLNTDGSRDGGFVDFSNGLVRTLVRQPDGRIVIGGDFDVTDPVERQNIARLEENGTVDPTFDTPGVTVRPLRQITGESEFGEVFFEDARVPRAHLVGQIGEGWRIAMTVLAYERGAMSLAASGNLIVVTPQELGLIAASAQRDAALARTTRPAMAPPQPNGGIRPLETRS